MGHTVVKFKTDDDGFKYLNDYWHLSDPTNEAGPAALCTQEFYGLGESAAEYECKTVTKGGITCPECLAKLRVLRSIKY